MALCGLNSRFDGPLADDWPLEAMTAPAESGWN
jgi:hypothetical protein